MLVCRNCGGTGMCKVEHGCTCTGPDINVIVDNIEYVCCPHLRDKPLDKIIDYEHKIPVEQGFMLVLCYSCWATVVGHVVMKVNHK
jgi:hypothetical protein